MTIRFGDTWLSVETASAKVAELDSQIRAYQHTIAAHMANVRACEKQMAEIHSLRSPLAKQLADHYACRAAGVSVGPDAPAKE